MNSATNIIPNYNKSKYSVILLKKGYKKSMLLSGDKKYNPFEYLNQKAKDAMNFDSYRN